MVLGVKSSSVGYVTLLMVTVGIGGTWGGWLAASAGIPWFRASKLVELVSPLMTVLVLG